MDKETLSNYGWIVICVLVLAVMIALATPFGTFIADGFKATYTGLFQTGDSALDVGLSAVGVSNKLPCGHGRKDAGDHTQKECGHYNCQNADCGCVPASCGVEGHWSNDGKDHTTVVNHTGHTYACQCSGWVVPEGGTYTIASTGAVYNAGEQLPCGYISQNGDKYIDNIYRYTCSGSSWGVQVIDKTKTEYGPILESINGLPVTNMYATFQDCTKLTTAPEIPSRVTSMGSTFYGCTSLTAAPEIPSSVTNMAYTFYNCTSLTTAPTIPSSVTNINGAFYGCTSLTTAPEIPSGVTNMNSTFARCTSLTTAPDMSNATSVTDMSCTFNACTSLTTAPTIPSSVTNINATFDRCTSLTTAPVIPSSVTNMAYTFYNCTSLTTAPEIPSGVTNMNSTFRGCTSLTTAPDMSNATSVTDMSYTFLNCTSLTGTITINANPSSYSYCFGNVDFEAQNLTLDGASTMLDTLGATGTNYCAECNGKCNGGH